MTSRRASGETGAEVHGARLVAGLELFDVAYPPHLTLPDHGHDHAFVCLVVHGGFAERYGDVSRRAGAGALLGYGAGERHSGTFAASGSLVFHVGMPGRYLEAADGTRLRFADASVEDETRVIAHELRVAWRERSEDLLLECLVADLLGDTLPDRSDRREPGPVWLPRVRALLDDAEAGHESLGEAAHAVGRHPSHLARAFRAATGQTLGAYRRRRQVRRAAGLLARGHALADAAHAAGFADQSHMSRVFKRLTGLTPATFGATRHRH